MSKKIKVNIPGFGERVCSNDVAYVLLNDADYFYFYKKGTDIYHNEYGPAIEWKDGSYEYYINNEQHRLNLPQYHDLTDNIKEYFVIGYYLGYDDEVRRENITNILIPKQENE